MLYLFTIREQSRSTAVRKDSSIRISLKMKNKHKITYAKMRETLLRATFFPAMVLREAVVEDVDEE
jgi:hypothetical protein